MPFVKADTAVMHPAVRDAELPSVDRAPVCQMGLIHHDFDTCTANAAFHARLAHQGGRDTSCAAKAFLLCDDHMREFIAYARTCRFGDLRCLVCGAGIRRPSQLVEWRAL